MKNLLPLIFNSGVRSTTLFLLGLLILLPAPANAFDLQCKLIESAQINASTIAPMQTAAENGNLYRVQVDTSNVSFRVNHFPFSTVEGQFGEFEGGLALPEEIEQSKQALFIINVASITTGDEDLNDFLKSYVFFNVEQFPLILFISTGFEWIDESTAYLSGNLTLHGITKPLVFHVVINTRDNTNSGKNKKLTMQASVEIQRSDFGMQGMQLLVSDKVTFNLKIEAFRIPT